MHETALVAHLLRRVVQEARAAGAARVMAVRLRVGEFAGVEPTLLEDAFQRQSAGTRADGARLEIVAVPLEALCDSCGHRFRVELFRFQCPTCGGCRTRVVAGEELDLESLAVTTEPEPSKVIIP
ncbi:MAG: hydrogenase maturation nickel metallochaperone HypA [Isosphaerales bacterium]